MQSPLTRLRGGRVPTILTGARLAQGTGGGMESREVSRASATPQQKPAATAKVRLPTDEPVGRDEMYAELGFDPKGLGENTLLIISPVNTVIARRLASEAGVTAISHFPTSAGRNDEADAFRHALWSFNMTKRLGAEAAKESGDAHEISQPNPDGERLMDLYNNHVGRRLALDPKNKKRRAKDVIMEALRNGQLQTRPFNVPGGRGLKRPESYL